MSEVEWASILPCIVLSFLYVIYIPPGEPIFRQAKMLEGGTTHIRTTEKAIVWSEGGTHFFFDSVTGRPAMWRKNVTTAWRYYFAHKTHIKSEIGSVKLFRCILDPRSPSTF